MFYGRFTLLDEYVIDRFSQLLRFEVALHFVNTRDINDFPSTIRHVCHVSRMCYR